jgi:hypothetical protein
MPLVDSPGEFVAHVYCRRCGRSVQLDPRRIPLAPLTERDRRRFWCMKCGGRGADVAIGWTTSPAAGSPPVSALRNR